MVGCLWGDMCALFVFQLAPVGSLVATKDPKRASEQQRMAPVAPQIMPLGKKSKKIHQQTSKKSEENASTKLENVHP